MTTSPSLLFCEAPNASKGERGAAVTTFGRVLRHQRVKTARTQSDVAHEAGVSQSLVSSLERGDADPRTVRPETMRDILHVYQFTSSAQQSMAQEYRLNVPPAVVLGWNAGQSYEAVGEVIALTFEGSISVLSAPTKRSITRDALVGLNPAALAVRDVSETDFATPQAAARVPIGSSVIFDRSEDPTLGKLCVFRTVDGLDYLGVFGEEPYWLLSYTPRKEPLALLGDVSVVGTVKVVYQRV